MSVTFLYEHKYSFSENWTHGKKEVLISESFELQTSICKFI